MTVTLLRAGGALYAPADPAAATYARFLRWDAQAPPPTLTLDDVWSQTGTPASVGYFAFVDGAVHAGFEGALRQLLPAAAPTATGFAWVRVGGATPVLQALAAVQAGADGPLLLHDVDFALPQGMMGLGLAGGSRMAGAPAAAGTLDGFTVTYPALAGAQPPAGPGISISLAGEATGALCFRGLMSAGSAGGGVVKQLWNVQVDPLRPFDAARTFQAYTPQAYLLTGVDPVYHITPLA